MKRLLTFVAAISLAAAAYADGDLDEKLLSDLKKGGYVLFIRHPKTNPDQADTDPLHLGNIKAQRHLTDEARQQAKALGEALGKASSNIENAAVFRRWLNITGINRPRRIVRGCVGNVIVVVKRDGVAKLHS